VIYRPEKAK